MKILIAATAVCALSACTSPAVSKAVGTGTDGATPIVVRLSDTAVTVENHAGRPLLNVRATITAPDATKPFVAVAPTIDAGSTSDLALSTFRNDDGTTLDTSTVHPAQVAITARDTLAKTYELTMPWKP